MDPIFYGEFYVKYSHQVEMLQKSSDMEPYLLGNKNWCSSHMRCIFDMKSQSRICLSR